MTGANHRPAPGFENDDETLSDGQQFLLDLKRAADPEDYPRLLQACGGRRAFVATKRVRPGNWMSLAIGLDKAQRVIDRLNEFSRFPGSEVDVPVDQVGAHAAVYQRTRQIIVAGLAAGKGTSIIAAECGLTRRAVQNHVSKMRKAGTLPKADPLQVLAAPYLTGGTSSAAALRRTPGREDTDLSACLAPEEIDRIRGLATAFGAPPLTDRPARIAALIAHAQGADVLARILAACAGEPVSLMPFSLASPEHPFRRVLPERDAAILAVSIEAAGLGYMRCTIAASAPAGPHVEGETA